MSGAKMKVERDLYGEFTYVFEKYPTAGTVNIYNGSGQEIDVFTNYDIGADFDAFEKACDEWMDDLKAEMGE